MSQAHLSTQVSQVSLTRIPLASSSTSTHQTPSARLIKIRELLLMLVCLHRLLKRVPFLHESHCFLASRNPTAVYVVVEAVPYDSLGIELRNSHISNVKRPARTVAISWATATNVA
jgi:hypothetical protein